MLWLGISQICFIGTRVKAALIWKVTKRILLPSSLSGLRLVFRYASMGIFGYVYVYACSTRFLAGYRWFRLNFLDILQSTYLTTCARCMLTGILQIPAIYTYSS